MIFPVEGFTASELDNTSPEQSKNKRTANGVCRFGNVHLNDGIGLIHIVNA